MSDMDAGRIGVVVVIIAAVIAYAVLSGVWVGTDSGWYRSLEQPSWQPPSWVFGVIWPYNFIALAAVSSVIAWRAPAVRVGLLVLFLVVSIAAALAWAYLFYVPHQLTAAALALSGAAFLTIPIVVIAFLTGPIWGVLLVPYQVWLALAASLSWGYVRLHG